MSEKPKHKLEVGLIPLGAWGRNVRAVISDENWQALRKHFGATFEHGWINPPSLVCETCGESKREGLHLHETWDFDIAKNIQKLTGFMVVCEDCHSAIHLGRSRILGLGVQAEARLAKVNGWSDEELRDHIGNAYKLWASRSCVSEDVYEKLLEEHLKKSPTEKIAPTKSFVPPYDLNLDWLIEQGLLTKNKIHWNWLNRPQRAFNKMGAMTWAKDMLASTQAVILDTETTGLMEGPLANPQAEVIELAIISMTGEVLYDQRFLSLFPIPERTTEIHKITNEMVEKCPSFKDEYPKILEILTGKIAITYNARFDQKVINNTCKLHNLTPPEDIMWECAMKVFKGYREPETQYVKLPNSSHTALKDCQAALTLIAKMSRNEHIDYQYPESIWQKARRLFLEEQSNASKCEAVANLEKQDKANKRKTKKRTST